VRAVSIRDAIIRLGQGAEVGGGRRIGWEGPRGDRGGAVRVDGEVEARRGRGLRRGDVVAPGGAAVRIA
jgi:hypothetical protein